MAASVQTDAAIRRWIVIHCEVNTPLCELPACRRCADNADSGVLIVVRLMDMAENREPNPARCRHSLQEFVAVRHTYGVQPCAAHGYRRMMKAHHDMRRLRCGDLRIQTCEFAAFYLTTGFTRDAAVDTDNQPVAGLDGPAVMKGRSRQRFPHERANVMITRYAVDGQPEFAKQFAKMLISAGAVVLNKVAGNDDEIRAPIGLSIVIEYGTKR